MSFPPHHLIHLCTRTASLSSLLIAVFLFLVCCNSIATGSESEDKLVEAMTAHLACYPIELLEFQKQTPLIATKDICLAAIYHELGAQPLWVTNSGPGKRAAVILDHLLNSFYEGLEPSDYETELLRSLWESKAPDDLARLDTLLTYNLVKLIHDLSYGQIKFHASDPQLFAEAGDKGFNPLSAVEAALAAPDLNAYLDSLPPQHQHYTSLKQALVHYRRLAEKTEWQTIPSGSLIRPGKPDDRLVTIQKRLFMTAEIEAYLPPAEIYNAPLVAAVTAFQKRHGLEADGIIGPKTLAALNIPIEDLITTIRVNMARWRWHNHDLGEDYVMVNIAGFSLKAVRKNRVMLDMPVIVGKFQHKTPIFSDTIKYLDFNPFWNITTSIARNEELPELRKNPGHLVERNIRLFSSWQSDAVELDSTAVDWEQVSHSQMSRYKLRQDPGPGNALGRVKFVFPNNYSIYLHDTPAQDLFHHTKRSFSHGCIRVSQPLALARFCLESQDAGWTAEKIGRIAAMGKRKVVRVNPNIPVHITYQTTWVDNEGKIHFNSDIYGRDAKLIKTLLD